jgi:hypothetical protein
MPNIELIANKYKKTEKDPEKVWANVDLDNLRRTECLCMNCDRKNESKPYSSCPVAAKIYKIAVEHNMAMAITKCGATDEKGLMYTKNKSL